MAPGPNPLTPVGLMWVTILMPFLFPKVMTMCGHTPATNHPPQYLPSFNVHKNHLGVLLKRSLRNPPPQVLPILTAEPHQTSKAGKEGNAPWIFENPLWASWYSSKSRKPL